MRATFLFLLLTVSLFAGEPPWPKELKNSAELPWKPGAGSIPKQIREALNGTFGFDSDDDPPQYCRFDLNGDGHAEYILESPMKRGGPMTAIFELHKGQWRQIARFQGAIRICSERTNGYHALETWSGRTGLYRTLRQFLHDRYHVVRIEEWEETESGQGVRFVRALDPKANDDE